LSGDRKDQYFLFVLNTTKHFVMSKRLSCVVNVDTGKLDLCHLADAKGKET
jgi:hypothetical protein